MMYLFLFFSSLWTCFCVFVRTFLIIFHFDMMIRNNGRTAVCACTIREGMPVLSTATLHMTSTQRLSVQGIARSNAPLTAFFHMAAKLQYQQPYDGGTPVTKGLCTKIAGRMTQSQIYLGSDTLIALS